MKLSSAALLVGCALSTMALGFTAVMAPWLCALLVLTACFVAAWITSWRTSRDVFAPLLPVTGYLFLGIGVRGLALREGWLPDKYQVPYSNSWLVTSVFLLGALATFCCVLGYRSQAGRRLGCQWRSKGWGNTRYTSQIVKGFSVVAAMVGLLSLFLLRQRFAGVARFGESPAVIASQTSKGGLFTIDMLAYFPFAGFMIAWRRKGLGAVGRVATLANLSLIIAWFVIEGRKSLLFEFILGLLILHHYLRRRIRGKILVLLAIPALVLISLTFYFKAYGFNTKSIVSQYSQHSTAEAVLDPLIARSYQFDAATMILAKTKSINDYRMGGTLNELLWFYIPRQWWPQKPLSFGYTFAGKFFPGANQTASYAPSMLGELYLDVGIPGVVAGFYLLGIALRASYEGIALSGTQFTATLYTIVLFRLTNMIEGPIAGHIEFLLAELMPVAVLVAGARLLGARQHRADLAVAGPRIHRRLAPVETGVREGGK